MNGKPTCIMGAKGWITFSVIAAVMGVAFLWSRWGGDEKIDVGRDSHANYSSATAESIVDSGKPRPAGDDGANETTNLVVLASDDPAKPVVVPMQPDEDGLFATLINKLSASDAPRERQALLEQAAAWLKSLPPDEAAAILLRFLESGKDFEVGMPFRVGVGGNLRSHPALRIAALDWLGQLAPEAAKEYSRKIFEQSDSADEWALALRNFGRLIQPGSDEYFSDAIRKLVTNERWLSAPSGGFAEAFDAIVYNREYSLLEDLVRIQSSHQGLSPLITTVIDSLTTSDLQTAIPYLGENFYLFDDAPLLRAQLMARADVRDDVQRLTVVAYLTSPRISKDEAASFLRIFPHQSRFLGHRLLSDVQVMPLCDEAKLDAQALALLQRWQSDTSLTMMRTDLDRACARVALRVVAAKQGGFDVTVD